MDHEPIAALIGGPHGAGKEVCWIGNETLWTQAMAAKPSAVSGRTKLSIAIERGAHVAVQEALLEHKLLGHTVVMEHDGKPVEVPPWEIELDASVLDPDKQEMARRAEIMWADKRRT